jgi:predicted nucleic acid-binding protein
MKNAQFPRPKGLPNCLSVDECLFVLTPSLREEGDNHILELAREEGASTIVTTNTKDFKGGELAFPEVRILRPNKFIKETSWPR